MFRISILTAILFILLQSCGSKDGSRSEALMKPASGKPGDIILLMDSIQWNGNLGSEIRQVFHDNVKGLNRGEPQFNLVFVDPRNVTSLLKEVKNLMIVTTFDNNNEGTRVLKQYYTQKSIQQIKSNPDYFFSTDKNQYARGQEVIYLFGQTEESLVSNLHQHGKKIVEHLNSVEEKRLIESLYKAKEVKGIERMLKSDYQCSIRIPNGYQVALQKKNFVWIRNMGQEIDKNIFIYTTDYLSEEQFTKEELINLRNKICLDNLYEDPAMTDSYVVTETEIPFIPVEIKETTHSDLYAVNMRGLWRTNNKSMGGPFRSKSIVNSETGKFYYIEGFLYSSGKSQREHMRELETIINTFEFIPNSNNN
ncbi:MAG: DUF4837 family protein [Cyclobacteriaceae bacterium]|nr:DUF4837 family protein [Cyclobacteriaceae bacterium]